MIIREYYTTRKDGVKLYKTYSDIGFYIQKSGTEETYDEAIDIENAEYDYIETTQKIETEEDLNNENH